MPSTRLLDCGLNSYSYTKVQFTPATGATDVWTLAGVNNAKVKVRFIELGGTASAIRTQTVVLNKRSAANTGGTSSNPQIARPDSADPLPQAILAEYTANPAGLGTLMWISDGGTFTLTLATTTTVPQDHAIFNYEAVTVKPITLNGGEFLCVNLGSTATIAGDKIDFSMWWTEGQG